MAPYDAPGTLLRPLINSDHSVYLIPSLQAQTKFKVPIPATIVTPSHQPETMAAHFRILSPRKALPAPAHSLKM